ncbi:hypothetical protein G7Z17_g8878 [Cylindrodendrum hubeiense]|uniref:UBC core domain-containing protein n=1 Tax=Cylindrodendrum hubeiense TaxID=595255 RepID=A0A9P5H7Q7_9HYPO|nr:hypothetical protein G7Z17_g8878 [Cylindrodendrum hubeiense]
MDQSIIRISKVSCPAPASVGTRGVIRLMPGPRNSVTSRRARICVCFLLSAVFPRPTCGLSNICLPGTALAVACRDVDVRNVKALIMGPHETPYEFGFFESLLSTNPYENEPGFEDANEESDKKAQKDYVQKIRHETLRISVIQRLEGYLGLSPDGYQHGSGARDPDEIDDDDIDESSVPFEPFKDLCKRRFLWYYESYLATIQLGKSEVKDGQHFVRMPFESPNNNSMDGRFNYTELERRLRNIKSAIDAEPQVWAEEGLASKARESTVAVNLQHQFEQVVESFKRSDMPHDVFLENGNPFVWVITYFGRPMTNLDGGLFRIKMNFSPRFPDEQPRVKFESKIFHHYIAADGTACYTPNPMRREDVKSHIEAIFAFLEEDEPAYDPRKIVNPEASKMYWGGAADDRKKYNRRLRRSVQQSMEDFPE